MKNILITLSILILLISCNYVNKKNRIKIKLPENTRSVQYNPQIFIQELPNKLSETSGLIYHNKLLWTLNDSGGKNVIYGFNFKGKIEKEIEIKDAKNRDWESLTQDKKHIYIGDFGNNGGNRKDLKIYKVKKKDIGKKNNQKVDSKTIKFQYNNQNNFAYKPKRSAFDCEALVEFNDLLYVFTKDWKTRKSTVYEIPKSNGDYKINPLDSFNVTGLITGADISPDKKKLALIGYKNYKPILWLFTDFPSNNFFNGKKTYVEMDSIYNAQTEAVCFWGNDSLLISCENTSTFQQQVFLIDLKALETYGIHQSK